MNRFFSWASTDIANWSVAHYAFFGTITALMTATLGVVVFATP